MKHTLKITFFLVMIFFVSQLVGLAVINEYIDVEKTSETGKTVVNAEAYNLTGVQPPEVENESYTWILIIIAVLVGTVMVLLIIRFKQKNLWKLWFFFAVFYCLRYAIAPFVSRIISNFSAVAAYSFYATLVIAAAVAFYKVFRPNMVVHNISELFIYGGLAALIVPIINMISAFALLAAISLYDMYAVWKSRHMVKMAKYQTESKIFAGLMLPYEKKTGRIVIEKAMAGSASLQVHKLGKGSGDRKDGKDDLSHKKMAVDKAREDEGMHSSEGFKTAILGGGDIAFPLLFSGVVFKTTGSFFDPLIVSITTTVALFLLLYYGKKDTFYPAMPFISMGCVAGYLITLIL
ncbi:hypothetical protein JXB31_04335 [Candidatus Woesearchaeota archaeon]|nr:hypothetical protein [Candidatus Woesearchaeota archaeon]